MPEALAHELGDLLLRVGRRLPRGWLPADPGVARGHQPAGALQGQRRRGQGEQGVEIGPDRLGPAEDGVEEAHWTGAVDGSAGLTELALERVQLGQPLLERRVRPEQVAEAEAAALALGVPRWPRPG